MSKVQKTENELSYQLRSFCDSKGRELFPEESSQVLNKLGLLYKTKSPDKISLIQSAALLNAAVVRQPSNENFQKDVKDLCEHVLECAGAFQKHANLITIAEEIKEMIIEMRKETNKRLKNIQPIRSKSLIQAVLEFQNKKPILLWNNQIIKEKVKIRNLKALQLYVVEKYTEIMACVSRSCVEIMGKSPCNYAIVGMGSLARKEITPFSDFEHIIVLEDLRQEQNYAEYILKYFRWYSVIFHIIVINLKETIVPSVWIRSLNDSSEPGCDGDWFFDNITPRGISFDGMMPHACKFPLGRTKETKMKPWTTELIKPVSEMAEYLKIEIDLQNGYHLADMLTQTCFVAGDEDIHETFCKKVNEIQQKQLNEVRQQQMKKQLEDDLENFNILNHLSIFKDRRSLNVKRVIYRSVTLFVTALGQLNNCFDKNTNFEILEDLRQRNIIDDITFHDLSCAVSFACHIRLYQYMRGNAQDDYISECSEDFFGSNKLNHFLAVVSKQEFVNFFSTVLRLQTMLADNETQNINLYFNKKTIWPSLAVKVFMKQYEEVIREGELYLCGQEEDIETDQKLRVMSFLFIAHRNKGNIVTAHNMFVKLYEIYPVSLLSFFV